MQVGGTTPASLLQTGAQGIQRGENRATQAADDIAKESVRETERPTTEASKTASSNPQSSQLASSLVELNQGEREVQASAKVVKAADETLGTLIDIKA